MALHFRSILSSLSSRRNSLAAAAPRAMSPWNTANSRNRRIFNDPEGLAAGRNLRSYLIQSYARDMGGGKNIMLKEISVPILVNGRHWAASGPSGRRIGGVQPHREFCPDLGGNAYSSSF
jgi:hypothetical protein